MLSVKSESNHYKGARHLSNYFVRPRGNLALSASGCRDDT